MHPELRVARILLLAEHSCGCLTNKNTWLSCRKIPENLKDTSSILIAFLESKTILEIKLLHLLCIVICHFISKL